MTQHKRWPYGTHMTRTPDNSMEERNRKGDWLGVARCFRPKKGKDVVFVDGRGNMVLGEVLGWSDDTWRIGQFHGQPRHTVKPLSRARCGQHGGSAYGTAVAISMPAATRSHWETRRGWRPSSWLTGKMLRCHFR
jgi:hypothetical protein